MIFYDTSSHAPIPVLLIGYGKMGKLHLRSLIELSRVIPLDISVVDRTPAAQEAAAAQLAAAGLPVQVWDHHNAAAQAKPPQVLVMALNEDQHAAAFHDLLTPPTSIRAIFSEKPLVATMSEAESLKPLLANKLLTLNTIIHFSPVFDVFSQQRAKLGALTPIGYEMLWWNDWVTDPRWTPGVVADLLHPIGIVGEMLGAGHLDLVKGHSIIGHINPPITEEAKIHTVHRSLWKTENGLPALLTASYARRTKDRRVTAYYKEENGATIIAQFDFDIKNEHGQFTDQLKLYRQSGRTAPQEIFSYTSTPDDINTGFASGVMSKDKVAAFMGLSFRQLLDPSFAMLAGRRADLDVSLRIQQSIEGITPDNPRLKHFFEDAADTQRRLDGHDPKVINQIGASVAPKASCYRLKRLHAAHAKLS